MSPTEAVTLVRYIEGGCPSMRMSENTPDVWYDVGLNEIPIDVAMEAARALVRTQQYVGVHDLIRESENIEHARRGALRRAHLEVEDPERFQIDSKRTVWGEDVDIDADEKRKVRRERLAEAFAKAKICRDVPKVDPRPQDTRMAEARAEVERVRKAQQPASEPTS